MLKFPKKEIAEAHRIKEIREEDGSTIQQIVDRRLNLERKFSASGAYLHNNVASGLSWVFKCVFIYLQALTMESIEEMSC